jgi:hypothetical protein
MGSSVLAEEVGAGELESVLPKAGLREILDTLQMIAKYQWALHTGEQ